AFPNDGLFPKRGKELKFTVNGKPRIVRGLPGEAAVITVNGQEADIHTPIHSNDVIMVTESTAGDPAKQKLEDLAEFKDTLKLVVDEKEIKIPRYASVNKELKTGSYEIQSGDEIEFLDYCTVAQLLEFMDLTLDYKTRVIVNNKVAHDDTKIYENFSVELVSGVNDGSDYHASSSDEYDSYEEDAEESVDESDTQNEGQETENEGKAAKNSTILTVLVNKNPVTLKGKQSYVFVDIFEYINFDTSSMKGEGLVTTLNGENAEYMAPLKDGDVIEVYWKM
ncbi:MAG: cell division protein FtsA, partial [Lachnospiraceae bacterium]|nr:cell division protein FtsA [Lachnospiraceae bacterium]